MIRKRKCRVYRRRQIIASPSFLCQFLPDLKETKSSGTESRQLVAVGTLSLIQWSKIVRYRNKLCCSFRVFIIGDDIFRIAHRR